VLLDETDGWQRKPDLPLYTPVIATFTFWISSQIVNCLWHNFTPTGLMKQEGTEYREVQEMKEQLFHQLPCMTTYVVAVWHSVTSVDIPNMCIMLLDDMGFCAISMLISKNPIG
jgi:hypothetical protein